MSADVAIVYATHRADPRFEWFADALAGQLRDDDVEVILVDGMHTPERTAAFTEIVGGRFAFRHVPPKPTPFAGPHRLTRLDFFSASSARNTGLVYAAASYVAFVDDLSVPMPGWWHEVRSAAMRGEVMAGAYQKHREMRVERGRLVGSRCDASGVDSRWSLGRENALVPIVGGQLFGCSFAMPRDLLVAVNGFDEMCDAIGGEDWHLGVRLEWEGARILYNRRMLTIESDELHGAGPVLRRVDRATLPSAYRRRLREFGVRERSTAGAWDMSHMLLDVLLGLRTSQTLGNYYLLSSLDASGLGALPKRFPRTHWFDRRALSEL